MFLLKPHVTGPEGKITSPDIIVDCLFVDGQRRALGSLTHLAWQQIAEGTTARPAYGVMALGGGALILPSLVMSDGLVIVGRSAWRLNNLERHIGEVTLNGAALANAALPGEAIARAGGAGDALPRGYLLVESLTVEAQEAVLADPVLDRMLRLKLHPEQLEVDRWGASRPRPRYSVGPTQKDVPHFI